MSRVEATLILANKSGLHARPASIFVQLAKKFQSEIKIRKGEKEANAKSILSVLSLGAECGDEVRIIAEGEDASDALNALVDLIKNRFGEE